MVERPAVVRDVVVVGGGAAGLGAALTLARARRLVTVVDAGAPRNAPADGVHGLLALDGVSPTALRERGRAEVTGYGGEIVTDEVRDVTSTADGFTVSLRDGGVLHARRLLIATGLVDELPDVPGVRERWGRDVLHCPYCHGWEVRDRRIGVLATGPMSVHQALMFRQWSDDVTFFAHEQDLDAVDRARFGALGITVIAGAVSRLEIGADRLSGVRMEDDRVVDVDAVAVATRMVARADVFAGIGIESTIHPAGSCVAADPTGRTSVPGVWVAGNSTDLSAQVSAAAADGARAAQHINADLVMVDADRAVAALAHGFDKDYWEQRWHRSPGAGPGSMGNSPPNPYLARETAGLTPGTALDAGCGAGTEAICLASAGWHVTAADISSEALARAVERAATIAATDRVRWVEADLGVWDPGTRFDLVMTHYAHPAMPQLDFYDRIAAWVAPGGTLLIVGHLHVAGATGHGHHPPAEASATAAAITARLDETDWHVVTAEEHVRNVAGLDDREVPLHDVVVRATRLR